MLRKLQIRRTHSMYSRRDRYFLIEANGELSFSGYIQRPAAERQTRWTGKGLWDERNQEIIIQPDTAKRIERLTGEAEVQEQKAREARDLIEEIQTQEATDG